MLGLISWIAAAPLDEKVLHQMVVELVPKVEASTGRHFQEIPLITLDTKAGMFKQLDAQLFQMGQWGVSAVSLESQKTQSMMLIEDGLAIYSTYDRGIHLISDNFSSYIHQTDVNPEMLLAPTLKCLIAHELTHALQDQYVKDPETDSEESVQVLLAMQEGHANLVAHQNCPEPLVWGFIQTAQGTDVLSSRSDTDDVPFTYGYGEQFMAVLQRVGGNEALWQALGQPPPTRAEFIEIVQSQLLPGWRDTHWLQESAGSLLSQGQTFDIHPAGAYEIFPYPDGRLQDSRLAPPVRAGLRLQAGTQTVYNAKSTDPAITVSALVMESLEHPTKWIQTRRETARYFANGQMEMGLLMPIGRIQSAKLLKPKILVKSGADDALCIRIQSTVSYLECWAAKGRLLLLTAQRQQEIEPTEHLNVLKTLLSLDLATEYPEAALPIPSQAVIEARIPTQPLLNQPTVKWVMYGLFQAFKKGQIENLDTTLTQVVASVPAVQKAEVVDLACRMAIEANRTDLAAKLALESPSLLEVDLRIAIAEYFRKAQNITEALKRLGPLEAKDPKEHGQLVAEALVIASTHRDKTTVLQLIQVPELPYQMRHDAVNWLIQIGEIKQTQRVLQQFCPSLEAEGRRLCEDDLRRVSGH